MKNYKDLNDYEIMYMIGENDEIAKEMMFNKYSPIIRKEASRLYKYGKKFGLELEDLEQEGYCALSVSMKKYDPNRNTLFYTYVLSAIRKKMSNLIRLHSCTKHTILNDSISLDQSVTDDDANLFSFIENKKSLKPLNELEYKELCDILKKQLYELSINNAAILELKINGFKAKEIAELLEMDRHVVTSMLTRIKKKINLAIEN